MADTPELPKTESLGSSAGTALAVGAGAVVAVAAAPILVPLLGLGAAATVLGTAGIAALGGVAGWALGGKK